MQEIRIKAFAKVNYALDVLGPRADGDHAIRTVLQSISLSDEVGLERISEGFELFTEPGQTDIGPPERNTAYVAWKSLRRLTGEPLPARVTLRKEIPAGAGLGASRVGAGATAATARAAAIPTATPRMVPASTSSA